MKFVLNRIKHYSPSGFLAELVSLKYKDAPFNKIHSYLVKIKKGYSRAQHYHAKKKEWMTPIFGKTLLRLESVKTKKRKEYLLNLNDENQKIIYIPPFWAHSITARKRDSGIIVFSLTPENKKDTVPYNL
jgi:dTDP-4-dehydrorhamnose 3,5-epimerase-like enzyme